MPQLNLNQNHIKGVYNGNLSLKIPLKLLKGVLNLKTKTEKNGDVWDKAYGLWKNKAVNALEYQRKIRKEWT